MIHFADKILAQIIDTSSDDMLLENVKQFENDINMLFTYFAYPDISLDYINTLLKYKSNKCAFWSPNSTFNIRECTTGMIYAKRGDECYIMLICTHTDHKNKGYATQMLKSFIEFMKPKVSRILLSSVDYAVSYYQRIGFEAIDDDISKYPYLNYFESTSTDKITTIMEYAQS